MIALVAAFALLAQMLAPAFAAAGPAMDGAICTAMGLQAAPDDGAPSPPDHDCKHCLCPAPTAEPPRTALVARIAYLETLAPVADMPRGLIPQARAPHARPARDHHFRTPDRSTGARALARPSRHVRKSQQTCLSRPAPSGAP